MLYFALAQPHPDFPLRLVASESALLRLDIGEARPDPAWSESNGHPVLREARRQLELYFSGQLRVFDLPLQPQGTPYQQRVWRALLEIPYGETRTYGELARCLQPPSVARAVGQANAANPIAIIIPCHRVLAAGGSLGGYGPGLERKRFLLDLESQSPIQRELKFAPWSFYISREVRERQATVSVDKSGADHRFLWSATLRLCGAPPGPSEVGGHRGGVALVQCPAEGRRQKTIVCPTMSGRPRKTMVGSTLT